MEWFHAKLTLKINHYAVNKTLGISIYFFSTIWREKYAYDQDIYKHIISFKFHKSFKQFKKSEYHIVHSIYGWDTTCMYLLYIFHKITFNITWCSAEQVCWIFFLSNCGDFEVGLECTQSSVININQSVIKVQPMRMYYEETNQIRLWVIHL